VALAAALVALAACVSRLRPPGADEPCEAPGMVGGIHEPAALDVVRAPRKKAWEASLGGEVAARPHVRRRLRAFPRATLADRAGVPQDDRGFLERLAADTWRGLDGLTDREHHLPVDHVRLADRPADVRVGDYANVTTVGLWLVGVIAAHDLGLLDRDGALGRIRAVLATLDRLESHEGWLYNYYDTTSLERTSNLVSFVDTSWLAAGLVVVRQAFPELADVAGARLARIDWRFFYDAAAGRMTHGWYVHRRAPSRYHYGVLYAESRLGSVLAIGSGQVPPSHWFRMVRTFPASCTWQSQTPHGRRPKQVLGETFRGGWYEWRDERYVPSWGGSAFEALMPTLVLDERRLAPASLGANDVAHSRVQRRYAGEILGWPVWGLSPSASPAGSGYGEYGARPLGSLGYGAGAVTPHASALALAAEPEAATANLRTLVSRYDVWGDFGLYDAVDPATGAVSRTYLALDQAMLLVALANHLTGNRIPARFAADPLVAPALPVLAAERFFD
jgi:hypothetical protein